MPLRLKQLIYFKFIFSILLLNLDAFSKEFTNSEITFSTGFGLISFAETANSLAGATNIAEAESGNTTSISGNLHYKFLPSGKLNYYLTGTFPLISSGGNSYFNLGGGAEYYFNDVGNQQGIEINGMKVTFTPKLRYFAGVEVGLGYLVYTTQTALKNDTLFELGLTGGIIYNFTKKWSLRGHTVLARGSGIATSGFQVKGYVGGTYFLGN